MHALWSTLHATIVREGRAALVTVLSVEGSAPREPGARMIVSEAGLRGTIGGGTLEHEAWQNARALLQAENAQARVTKAMLGPDLGQCCGGRVTLGIEIFSSADVDWLAAYAARERGGLVLRAVFGPGPHATRSDDPAECEGDAIETVSENLYVERFSDRRTVLHLFGAGHVGIAVAMALAPLPFRIVWYDPRADVFPSRVPGNAETRLLGEPGALRFEPDDMVLIMTHSHPLDLALSAAALRSPARFIGLIGSATKKARFLSRLRAAGFTPEVLHRLVCPIGMAGIGGKEPAVIAASVAAQLLAERERSSQNEWWTTRPHHARIAMGAAE